MTHKLATLTLYVDQVLRTKSPGFVRPILVDGNKIFAEGSAKPEMEVYAQGPVTDFVHGATGGFTEVGEFADQLKRHLFYGADLDYVNLGEECGDMWWYIALIVHAADYDKNKLDKIIHNASDQAKHHRSHNAINAQALLTFATSLGGKWAALNEGALFDFSVDPSARVFLGGHPNLETVFLEIVKGTAYLGALLGHETHKIWESNIAKLYKRYPNKFDTDAAIHRTLTEERASLEAHHDAKSA